MHSIPGMLVTAMTVMGASNVNVVTLPHVVVVTLPHIERGSVTMQHVAILKVIINMHVTMMKVANITAMTACITETRTWNATVDSTKTTTTTTTTTTIITRALTLLLVDITETAIRPATHTLEENKTVVARQEEQEEATEMTTRHLTTTANGREHLHALAVGHRHTERKGDR